MKKFTVHGSAGVRTFCLLSSIFCLLFSSGCCSMYAVRAHNSAVDAARLVQVQPAANGQGAMLTVDVLNVGKGYFAAWAADPIGMLTATAEDALMVGGIAYAAQKVKDHYSDSGSSDSAAVATPSSITSGRSTVINYTGTVNINESQQYNQGNQ